MRGRSVLKEPSCQSICAFCAHRLGAARKPSHVQRRFLQSSRPTQKPPVEGVALREEESRPGPSYDPPKRSAPTWGALGSAATWGKSSAGNGRAQQSAAPAQFRSSTQNSASSELLPHEQRAKDLLTEQQKRQRLQDTKQDQETSRTGRPVPPTLNIDRPSMRYAYPEQKVEWAREQVANRLRKEAESKKKEQEPPAEKPTLFRNVTPSSASRFGGKPLQHQLGDPQGQQQKTAQTEHKQEEEKPKWSMLRRRKNESQSQPAPTPPVTPADAFLAGRRQREEQFLFGGHRSFVPLTGSRNNNLQSQDTQKNRDQTQGPIRDTNPNRVAPRAGGWQRTSTPVPVQNDPPELSTTTAAAPIPAAAATTSYSPMRTDTSQSAPKRNESNKEEVEEEEPKKKKKERRKRSTESDYLNRGEAEIKTKGKEWEKARRRGQFVESAEESAEARAEAAARAEARKQRKLEKEAKKAAATSPIFLPEYISVANLATALKVKLETFVEKMNELGYEETGGDHILNAENAGLIAMEYNYEAVVDRSEQEDLKAREPAIDTSTLPPRPPVVTIMGHVDHGKTTLLDYLRKSSVAATEHGGITQHIGAFSVPMPSGKLITFLDTPGHAAFLNMRQRGANVTDIVILVVAADDSVKPQTIEAINHAKAAKVPVIVAINKIDKEDTNVKRVKQDLARHGVDVEDFGGDTQAICVSGKTGQGMQELEESVVALSEIIDMRAEIDGQAEGWVLEASIKSMGKVATVLVRRGTLRVGDFIVAGKTWARIRCLRNEAGVEIDFAGPGTPVEIDGWREQPLAGDEVLQAPDEAKSKSVVDYRIEKEERLKLAEDMEVINEIRKAENERKEAEKEATRLAKEAAEAGTELIPENQEVKESGPKQVHFIVKGDVSGSVEAVIDSVSALGNAEVSAHILRSGVGQISEFDIEHAAAAKGVVINFNTVVEPTIMRLAEISKVKILDHNIIYRLVDEVKAELSKLLTPLITHKVLGEAEVSQIFSINIKGRQQQPFAGCKVRNGTITRNAKVRVHRKDEKLFDGTLASLKNVKKDVQEMKKGSECGIGFDGWYDFEVGDLIQAYETKEEKRYL